MSVTRDQLYQAMEMVSPNCEWDEAIDGSGSYWFKWKDKTRTAPTADQVNAALAQLPVVVAQAARAKAYPAIGDQLDAIWKALSAVPNLPADATTMMMQIQAVKAKYPIPAAPTAATK